MLSINMNDVITVLQSCRPQIIALVVCLLLAIIATVACVKMKKPLRKLIRKEAWIAFLVAVVVIVNVIICGPMNTMVALATGSGSISEESISQSEELCTDIAEEGMVLLKNEGNALPLENGKNINVFGWSSTNPLYGGTGSGSMSAEYETVTILDSLRNAGFQVNEDLVSFYTGYSDTRPTVGMWGQDWTVKEPSMDDYNAAGIFESAKEFSDTAVVVIARSGGEGADLPTSISSEDTFVEGGGFGSTGVRYSENADDIDTSRHYLELSNRETQMLERVTADYANVIVVINSANTMELGFLDEYDSIKAAIWTAGPGQTGFTALGEILAGTVNPSGKTVDTFVKDLTAAPNYNNIGNFIYDNMDEHAYTSVDFITGAEVTTIPSFVNYVEGIYVGYKFYETAYAEAEAGNMEFDYDAMVQYPFGYGLSYTTFTQEMGEMTEADGVISFDVTVTNTGDVAGKDVVEVYYNPPYTNGGIEKAATNLVAFDKTEVLEPGASETVTISFNAEDMASFDENGKGCYVLEAGDYQISINTDAHTVIDSKSYTVASDVVYDESNPRTTDDVAATSSFEDAAGDFEVLSRADGFANYADATAAPKSYSLSDEKKATFINNANYNPEDYNNADDVMPTTGANNGLTLMDMRGLAYDDEQWDLLLDQLTVGDMDSLIAYGGYSTAAVGSVGKPQTTDCDGPASINNNFTGKASIGFPAATMIAATWNEDLANAFGQAIGKMADEMGVSGWYAPAMNIHRSAFAGRNFEYYSEDGVMSGKMAASAVAGAEEYGVYSYIKHFALNDQETNRCGMLCTWAGEQAIREIYLKPFELAVKVGGADAVMSSFNYVGTIWAGAYYPLQTTVLRDEWGFRGFVLTDYYGVYGYMDADQAIRGGTDMCLAPMDTETNHLTDQTSATSIIAARNSAHNILYTVANSRACASEQGGLENWQIILIVVDVIGIALAALLEVLTIKKYKKSLAAGPVVTETNAASKTER